MKTKYRFLCFAFVLGLVLSCSTVNALALTESEVQAQVNAVGKETVTGNVFVWFLCAIAFLKVSQKIDSFMSSLGINVGHTGGSMLGEMMIAARGVSLTAGISGHSGGGAGGTSGGDGSSFLQGGLAGTVGHSIEKGATKYATGNGAGGVGGIAYSSSVSKGGGFANRIIGGIAAGKISSVGSISGDNASDALMSYLGYTAIGKDSEDIPSFSNVEIGGGRIMATETSKEHPEGIAMGMYHADQYMPPEGSYTTVTTADGSSWYKQYAMDTVERTPREEESGAIAYTENIVKKLPKVPPRKDRI